MNLEYVGFRKLRAGKIHLYCPECGRRHSNADRGPYDPPKAVLAHVKCPDCGMGDKDSGEAYLDARGRWVDPFEDER